MKKRKRRDRNRGRRFIIALLAIACLLSMHLSNYALFKMLAGPKAVDMVNAENIGDFITIEIDTVYGFYAESRGNLARLVSERYILIPVGSKLMTVTLTERHFEVAEALYYETYEVINGERESTETALTITGIVEDLEAEARPVLNEWFSKNADWMQAYGLVGEVTDYGEYLSRLVIRSDYVAGIPSTRAIPLTIISLICLAALMLLAIRSTNEKKLEKLELDLERKRVRRAEAKYKGRLETTDDLESVDAKYRKNGRQEIRLRDDPENTLTLYDPESRRLNWYGFNIRIEKNTDDSTLGDSGK